MARTFPSGTQTAKVMTVALWQTPAACSYCLWVKDGSTSTSPRLWDRSPGTVFEEGLAFTTGRGSLDYSRRYGGSGSIATWQCSLAGVTFTSWYHLAVTHTGGVGTAAASCQLYVNGQPVTTTLLTSNAGALTRDASEIVIGNRRNNDRGAGGSIAYLSAHDGVLTRAEIEMHMRTGFTPRGLIGWWPLFGEATEPDWSGNQRNGTVTGTTVTSGPPVRPYSLPR
jgi:hypothetical protein